MDMFAHFAGCDDVTLLYRLLVWLACFIFSRPILKIQMFIRITRFLRITHSSYSLAYMDLYMFRSFVFRK